MASHAGSSTIHEFLNASFRQLLGDWQTVFILLALITRSLLNCLPRQLEAELETLNRRVAAHVILWLRQHLVQASDR
jgi:hypothetical protein